MLTTSTEPGQRACISDHQNAGVISVEIRIVDPMMVNIRAFKHDGFGHEAAGGGFRITLKPFTKAF